MPINMDPAKKRRKVGEASEAAANADPASKETTKPKDENLFVETEADREKALAEAEWKNLWDATEVIDMDRW
jgi:hypothetical protein